MSWRRGNRGDSNGSSSGEGTLMPIGSFFYWMLPDSDPAGAGDSVLKAGTTIPAGPKYATLRSMYGSTLPVTSRFHRPTDGSGDAGQLPGDLKTDTTAPNGLTVSFQLRRATNTSASGGAHRYQTTGSYVTPPQTVSIGGDDETAPVHMMVDVWFVAT